MILRNDNIFFFDFSISLIIKKGENSIKISDLQKIDLKMRYLGLIISNKRTMKKIEESRLVVFIESSLINFNFFTLKIVCIILKCYKKLELKQILILNCVVLEKLHGIST